MKTRDLDAALKVFRDKGGTLRTRDMIAHGVHTDALYALRQSGRIVELGRGLYRLADVGEAEHPDLAVVAARAPNAAVCLISALSYHDITTQIPSSVHLAVPRRALAAQVVGAGLVDVERHQVHGRIMVRAVPAVTIQQAVDDVLRVRVLEIGGDNGGE